MTESELLTQVLDLCDKYGLLYFHSTNSKRDIGRGWPDLAILGRRLIFAELKSQVGAMTPDQVTWKYKLIAAGQTHYQWKPQHLAEGTIERILSEL
jgi:hypothetical protein